MVIPLDDREEMAATIARLRAENERLKGDVAWLFPRLFRRTAGGGWLIDLPLRNQGYANGSEKFGLWHFRYREDAEAALWSALEASRAEAGREDQS